MTGFALPFDRLGLEDISTLDIKTMSAVNNYKVIWG